MTKTHWNDLLLAGLAPALWGTTYVVTSEWLPADYPLFIAAMRALPAGLALCLLLREWPRGDWWWRSAVLGALNIGAFFALLFIAVTRLPGGVAATLGAMQPLMVLGLAWLLLGDRPRLRSVGGALAGLGGVALVVLTPAARLDGLGVAAMAGATLAMAAGTVVTKRWGRPASLLSFTAWQLLAGGLLLLPVALLVEGAPPPITASAGLGLLYMGTVNTALAYVLWFRGISRLPAATMPMLGLLTPVVALAAGYALTQERLTPIQLGGAAIVLASVAFSQRGAAQRSAPAPAQSAETGALDQRQRVAELPAREPG